MIELKNILMGTEEDPILRVSNFKIYDGDIIGIIGPSGSGKTSLLRAILMLDPFMKGEVLLNGEVVNTAKNNEIKARKRIGYLPQNLDLFSNFTVIENVMRPQVDLQNEDPTKAYNDAFALLRRVGLAKKLFAYPDELSASEKQRVAIVRALCMDSDILVFDEPTSLLDRVAKIEIQTIIQNIVKKGVTLIFVTNDINFARQICNRVVYVDENTIYEEGPAKELIENPVKAKTKKFINSLSLLEIQINDIDYNYFGIVSRINQYALSRSASKKTSSALNFAFEELAKNIILPRFIDEEFKLNVVYEFEEKNNRFIIIFKYTGAYFSPEDAEDELALMILKHSVSDMTYEKIDEDGYKNKVTLIIDN